MKISIVTPSFNHARWIGRTIDSVLGQRGGFELEHLVMDGGSTDGTRELLAAVDDPRFSWVSEPDDGQSDAINKGLARADGDVVAWLNSDDLYAEGALAAVAEAFAADPGRAWLTGGCRIVDAEGRPIRKAVTRYKRRRLARYRREALLRENFISQPATFWRPGAVTRDPPIDPSLHWAMDYDLWLRLSAAGDPIVLDRVLADFRLIATSKTGNFSRRQYDEDLAVARRHLGDRPWASARRRLHTEKIVLAYRVLKLLGR